MARKKTVKSETTDLAQPQNRTEEFLAKIAGLVDTLPQGEFSRLERYLKYIAENGGGGGGGVTSFNTRTGAVVPESGDYDAEMVGARASNWMPSASDVGAQVNLGFVEDTTYSGCLYRMVGDVKEWLNPPMVGIECRTTERWGNKPVYVNSVSAGAVAANSTSEVSLSIANLGSIIDIRGNYYQSPPLTFYSAPNTALTLAYDATNAKVRATNNTATQLSSVLVVLKYTKSTD